jgi:dienelactone hydrolase
MQSGVDADRIGAVGASYSGEAVGEALRRGGVPAAAYVMLSPGSFSDESIAEVDAGRARWLLIRTLEEGRASRPVMDALFEALSERSKLAEIRVIPGKGHATRVLAEHPFIVLEIADWLAKALQAESE